MSLRRIPQTIDEKVADLYEQLRRLQSELAVTPISSQLLYDQRGDILVGAGDNTPARLPPGAEGTTLRRRVDAPLGVAWEATDESLRDLFTGPGVLLVGLGPGVPDGLAIGPDGTVLTADSAASSGVSWSMPAASDAELVAWLALGLSA